MKFLSIIFLFLGLSQVSQANVPYGMAGCGLWSQVVNGAMTDSQGSQSNELIIIAGRYLVLNSQTTSITSGLMNCVEGRGMASTDLEQEVFVTANLPSLQQETAQGGGEHLNALAEIFGCSDKAAFSKLSQDNYTDIFATENPKDILNSFKSSVKNSNTTSCSRS